MDQDLRLLTKLVAWMARCEAAARIESTQCYQGRDTLRRDRVAFDPNHRRTLFTPQLAKLDGGPRSNVAGPRILSRTDFLVDLRTHARRDQAGEGR